MTIDGVAAGAGGNGSMSIEDTITPEEGLRVLKDLLNRNIVKVSDLHSSLRAVRSQAGPGWASAIEDDDGDGERPSDAAHRREKVFSKPVRLDDGSDGGAATGVDADYADGVKPDHDYNTPPPSYPKSDEAKSFLENSLMEYDNFLFASLTPHERSLLVNAMQPYHIDAETTIIRQGDVGDYFYVVEKGHVRFHVDGIDVGGCSRGASFGELALLYNCPRAATCKADSECDLWKVDQKTFRYILARNRVKEQRDMVNGVLRKVPFLSELDVGVLNRIADALTSVTYDEGESIITKGDIGEDFFVIREGRAKVTDISVGDSRFVDQELGPGEFFGERALLTGEPRTANVKAVGGGVTCLRLGRDTFERMLGPLQGLIDQAMKKRVLVGMSSFATLQPREIDRLVSRITEVSFSKGHKVAEAGRPMRRCLHVIYKGKIEIVNTNGVINHLQEGGHFGESTLRAEEGAQSTATITAVEDGTKCGILTREDIEEVVGPIGRLGRALSLMQSLTKLETIDFNDLRKIRILGMGAFGKVWLAHNPKTDKVYALKVLDKRQVLDYQQEEGVVREKNILASIQHPFVLDLVCSHQDERNLYMVIDLLQGGELFNVVHTDRRDGVPNGDAVFYAACVLEGMAHLHHRNICYRDLKPENVLMDAKGYCIIVDLGFAKVVTNKTYTLCGTPEYLAPEIVLSKGHNKGVDYWAFGVLIYEMLIGRSPFYSRDQVKLFRKIVQGKFAYPSPGAVTMEAEDIIAKLLVKNISGRLGCLAGADADVRDHPWFAYIDTEKLLKREIEAPWIPEIKDPLDSSHFDSFRREEAEAPSSKPPLTARQQEFFKDF